MQEIEPAKDARPSNITIPVVYFPGPENFPDSGPASATPGGDFGFAKLRYRCDEVAFVLIDTWNTRDPPEGGTPTGTLKNTSDMLNTCREKGIAVIHAPSRPVVNKYKQYKKINKTVTELIASHTSRAIDPNTDYLRWPPLDYFREAWTPRYDGRKPGWSNIDIKKDLDISRFLTPLDTEHVVFSFDEFRFVLWKERIRVILYAGSSLNECMLHRDAGLNHLAGVDTKVAPFVLVVLADCSDAFGTPFVDAVTTKHVILHYMGSKLAYISNSRDLIFEFSTDETEPLAAEDTVQKPQNPLAEAAERIFARPPQHLRDTPNPSPTR